MTVLTQVLPHTACVATMTSPVDTIARLVLLDVPPFEVHHMHLT
jgi:hypothetical protein